MIVYAGQSTSRRRRGNRAHSMSLHLDSGAGRGFDDTASARFLCTRFRGRLRPERSLAPAAPGCRYRGLIVFAGQPTSRRRRGNNAHSIFLHLDVGGRGFDETVSARFLYCTPRLGGRRRLGTSLAHVAARCRDRGLLNGVTHEGKPRPVDFVTPRFWGWPVFRRDRARSISVHLIFGAG